MPERVPVLYIAPWVDYGGTDKGTIDWFRWLDRDRFAPSLVTTQPSPNRRLAEVTPYAEEVWALPDLMAGKDFPPFIFDFIHTRGVELLHVMNSRLAYNLLPDLASLPRPPKVVVQLHVEEQDKSGYVRYVTTRYGNLVSAFSVTSHQLADAVAGYDVSRSKCRVIYTGVDAIEEFNPERTEPIPLESGPFHILYPGRIEAQKDPLLMVEVAAALQGTGADFLIHVVGEGTLERDLRRKAAERGVGHRLAYHPPTHEIARWYQACDALLMTSAYEGVPYVIYEAMAMELPIVAPALPGNLELMGDVAGTAVEPRDDVAAYVAALRRLIDNPAERAEIGAAARRRVLDEFSLEKMGREHSDLYEELLADPQPVASTAVPAADRNGGPEPLRFRRRPSRGHPLVSVIVPCFNHGRYLPECIASIRRQSYPAIETIVADDASAEPETIEALDLLEHEEGVTVVRLPRNSGPSAARNAAVSRAQGRYVLPLDADNVLEDDAVERLVEQLQGAGEQVGFIYPNVQYFGNRNDYFQAPDYNLYALLRGNFCDTCSLIDRDVFDAGLRYPEDILLGHEDWDFALALAARGVRGEPATARTFYLRKHGFNRSDEVEHAQDAFGVLLAGRYPGFFDAAADLKARWAPALSIVELDPMEPDGELVERTLARLHRQSTGDAELVLRADRPWPVPAHGPALRRVPATLGRSLAEALGPSLEAARGRYVLVTVGSSGLFLSDPAFVEKVLRTFEALPQLGGIAFTDTGHGFPYRPIHDDENVQLAPHSLIWRTDQPQLLRDAATVVPGKEIESLTGALARSFLLQWRHAPAGRSAPRQDRYEGPSQTRLSPAVGLRPSARAERDLRLSMEPHIPRSPAGIVRRLRHTGAWVPPETAPLCRHRDAAGSGRLHSNDRTAPPGYTLEFELGSINLFSLPGTARLVQTPEGSFELRPRDDPPRDGDGTLGFVEQAPLPLLTPLQLAREPEANQHVLVAGEADPLTGAVEILGFLGWIEPYPSEPRFAPQPELTYGGAVGLVRSADLAARRHVYGVGRAPESAQLVGELGALLAEPLDGSVPVWLTDRGFLITDRYRPEHRRPALTQGLRWVLAPLAWRGSVEKRARVRAALRRAASLPGKLVGRVQPGRATTERPLGYLMAERSPALHVPLYAARHPVTGDQLLTRHRLEAADMGYVDVVLLGYLSSQAPVTREASLRRVSIPWASRFGLAVRTR